MALHAHIANSKTASKNGGAVNNGTPFFTPVIQPKLSVNQPGDMYEQEADAMADSVMRMADVSSSPQSFFRPTQLPVQRKCQHCEEEDKKAQRKESGAAPTIDTSTENYISNLGGGRALDKTEREFFEPRMGYDLSTVRLHNDDNAHQSAKSINALAYTHANNIVFGAGQYQPGTDSGKRLMAHELTHTIQQTGTVQKMVQRQPVNPTVDPTNDSMCTMHFKQGTTEFTDAKEFAGCMKVIKDYLKANSTGKVELHGFASEEGTPAFNLDLSKRRAAIVLTLLKQGGTDTSRITTEGHGADTTHLSIPNELRRRVEVLGYKTINFGGEPEDHIEIKPTCPMQCATPITLYSDTTNCGSGDDFKNADKLSGPSGIKNNLKVQPFTIFSESTLLADMISGPTGLETLAGTPGKDAANYFYSGVGGTVTHDISTAIGKAADKSATFATTSSSVEAAFHKLIAGMAGTPALNSCSTLKLTAGDVPKVDFPFPKSLSGVSGGDLMLKAIIGGTHGIEVKLTGFTVDCDARTYSATIQYNICDNFGVDETDLYSDSLIAFWILQHMKTGHAAFINDILLTRTFTKSF